MNPVYSHSIPLIPCTPNTMLVPYEKAMEAYNVEKKARKEAELGRLSGAAYYH